MTMPSGSDPSGYSLDGVDGFILGGSGLSGLGTRTEANVRAAKTGEVQNNDIVSGVLGAIFNGLRAGISIPLAIIEALVQNLFGIDLEFGSLDDAIAAIKTVPILGDLVEVLTGIEDGDLGDLGTWFNVNIVGGIQSIVDTIVHALTGLPSPGAVLDDVFDGLNDLFNVANDAFAHAVDALGGVGDLIHKLLTDPGAVLGAIPQQLVSGLQGALNDANTFIKNVVAAVISGIRGIPFVGGTIADILSALTGTVATYTDTVQTNQVNAQNFTISTLTAGQRNPFWVSRYAVADVSFPEFLHMGLAVNNVFTNVAAAFQATAANQIIASVIVCSQDTVYDTVTVPAYYTGTAPTGLYVEVFRRAAATGSSDDFKLVFVSGNFASQVPLSTAPGAGLAMTIEVPLGGGLVANAGEAFLVRMIIQGTVIIPCLKQSAPMLDNGYLFTAVTPGATAAITQAQFVAAGAATSFTIHACLAVKNPVLSDQSYSDDANRVNLGPLWMPYSVTTTDSLGITGNRFGYQGTTNGSQCGIYVKRTIGAQARVDGDFHGVQGDQGLFLSANREGTQVVYLGVTATAATIYSGSFSALTPRASVATTVNDTKDGVSGLPWSLYYTPSTNTYTVLKDGEDILLSWIDTGNVVTHTVNEQFGGMRFTRTAGVNSGLIDNWTLRDWAAPPSVLIRPAGGALLTLTGSAPVVRLGTRVVPGDGSLTLTGFAPVVRIGEILRPTGGALTLTGSAPIVRLDGAGVVPGGGLLTLTGSAPLVVTPRKVTPSGASLTITGSAPGVQIGTLVAPSGRTLTLTGAAPVVITPRLVTPSGKTLTLTGSAPVVATPRTMTPGGRTLTITGSAPTVTIAPAGFPYAFPFNL